MDDVAGAASCSEEDLRQFLEFASSFHPSLEYTWSVSSDKLPFLDIYMKPQADRIATSIHYKTRIATLTSTSVHPIQTVSSHPYLIVSFSGPVYMEKSCPGKEGHPPSQVNFSKRLYGKKVDPFA